MCEQSQKTLKISIHPLGKEKLIKFVSLSDMFTDRNRPNRTNNEGVYNSDRIWLEYVGTMKALSIIDAYAQGLNDALSS